MGSFSNNLVTNKIEIIENLKTLDTYLNQKLDPYYEFALNLIKRGTCFIVVKIDDYKFYPSRFIGYISNAMEKHINNEYIHVGYTNKAISKILNHKPIPNSELNNKYRDYCEKLGFIANEKGSWGIERKFWNLKEL